MIALSQEEHALSAVDVKINQHEGYLQYLYKVTIKDRLRSIGYTTTDV